mgnify:CR=1 FL=1
MGSAEQNTFDWWLERLGKITASEIGVLMVEPRSKTEEFTKTQTAYIDKKACDLIYKRFVEREKLQLIYEEEQAKFNNIPDVVRGKEHEPYARMAFECLAGVEVEQRGFMVDPKRTYFGASPDGVVTIKNRNYNIEIKCPRLENHLRNVQWRTTDYEVLKPDYKWQMVAQAHLCDINESIFISFCAEAPESLQLCTRVFTWTTKEFEQMLNKIDYFSGIIEHRFQQIQNMDEETLGLTGWH